MKAIFALLALGLAGVSSVEGATSISGTFCGGQRAVISLIRQASTGAQLSSTSQSYTSGAFFGTFEPGTDGSRYLVTIQCPSSLTVQNWLIPDIASATPAEVAVPSYVSVASGWYWDTVNRAWKHVAAGISSAAGVGTGDVTGTGTPFDGQFVVYDGVTGKAVKPLPSTNGIPLFTLGVPTYLSTTGTGNIPRQTGGTFSGPIGIVKADVGLNNVDNYATASQAEAEAGSATNKFMTPQRVAQAITALAPSSGGSGVSKFAITTDAGSDTITVSNAAVVNLLTGDTKNAIAAASNRTFVPTAGNCWAYFYEEAGTLKVAIDSVGGCAGTETNLTETAGTGYPVNVNPIGRVQIISGNISGSAIDDSTVFRAPKKITGLSGITATETATEIQLAGSAGSSTGSVSIAKCGTSSFTTGSGSFQTADTITTGALPAGSRILLHTRWTHTGGTASAPVIQATLNGTALISYTLTQSNTQTGFSVDMDIEATSATATYTKTSGKASTGGANTFGDSGVASATVNIGSANTLVVQGRFASGSAEALNLLYSCATVITAQ